MNHDVTGGFRRLRRERGLLAVEMGKMVELEDGVKEMA